MPPAAAAASAAAQGRGSKEDKRAVAEQLLVAIEWAAHDRDQPVVESLMAQLEELGEATPTTGKVFQRIFLAGLDQVAAMASAPDDYKGLLDQLDSHHDLFAALGRDGERLLFEARVGTMRQAAVAALRDCLPPNMGLDVEQEDIILQPYYGMIDKFFPSITYGTPGKALKGGASPAATAAASASASARGHQQAEADQDEAHRTELMRNVRAELIRVTDAPAAPQLVCVRKCLSIIHMHSPAAFVAQIRAMTKRVEGELLGDPQQPRVLLGTDPEAARRQLELSVR
jgi:hypothetical protein